MRELAALQARFGACLAGEPEGEPCKMFVGVEAQVRKRMAIYRNNTQANAAKALGSAYPVVEKIVGTDFFSGLARQYSLRFPSQSGDLNEYGEAFAEFLAEFAPARELPYLAEEARLEWQVHRAHYAADAMPFDVGRLSAIAPDQQLCLRLRLHPACRLVHSAYPLARLWLIHQPQITGSFDVDLEQGPTHTLVFRRKFRVEVAQITDAESAFLAAAVEGATLEKALSAAQSCDAGFDLGRCLMEWVGSSVIVDFMLDGDTGVDSRTDPAPPAS